MTMVNPYCTLSEYKAWNTIDTTNAGDDVVIEQIIESISRQIDGICGRFFYVTTATVKYYTAEEATYSAQMIYPRLQVLHLRQMTTATELTKTHGLRLITAYGLISPKMAVPF